MATLQIDAINTVIRSHYMPLYSRLGHYDRGLLDAKVFHPKGQAASKRSYFEYWGHECSLLPLDAYPLFRWRMEDAARGVGCYKQLHEMARSQRKYIDSVRREIQQRGPTTSRDISTGGRGPGMWEWSESKQALEYLFWIGEIASVGRRGFERLYAVAEQAFPSSVLNENSVPRIEAQAALIEIAARALGVATEADLRDYFRLTARDASAAIAQLIEDKRLLTVQVEGWQKNAFIVPGTSLPRTSHATALLTPFDPLVWHRDRTLRLFDFHYRIEIYVPQSKRKYGYYVLPFLYRGQLGARVDLKADRENGRLLVLGAWSEEWAKPPAVKVELVRSLADALKNLSLWLNLEGIKVQNRGDLATRLRRHLT